MISILRRFWRAWGGQGGVALGIDYKVKWILRKDVTNKP